VNPKKVSSPKKGKNDIKRKRIALPKNKRISNITKNLQSVSKKRREERKNARKDVRRNRDHDVEYPQRREHERAGVKQHPRKNKQHASRGQKNIVVDDPVDFPVRN
jgi:hypothetical protein